MSQAKRTLTQTQQPSIIEEYEDQSYQEGQGDYDEMIRLGSATLLYPGNSSTYDCKRRSNLNYAEETTTAAMSQNYFENKSSTGMPSKSRLIS